LYWPQFSQPLLYLQSLTVAVRIARAVITTRKLEHATATDPIDQQLHRDQKEAAALLKWLGDGQLSMSSDNALHPARTILAEGTYIQARVLLVWGET